MLTPWTRPLSTRVGRVGLLLALLALAACQRDAEPVPGAPDEPVAAVEALAEALREGDLKRYAELSLPPAMHAQQKALWRQQVAAKNPVDAEQAQRYAELMAQLTAPDAEAALWAKAEPKLVALEQELGPKWTLGVTMLSGFATTAISASETMSEAEKGHATGVVTALAEWAGDQAQFTDRERAKQALGVAVRTARELDLPDVAAIEALEYDPMLEKAGVAFRAFKEVVSAYGIDADAALSQVQAEVIAIDGPSALVRVRYPLLGQEVRFEQPMRQIDGGWYREDAIEALERSVAELDAAPATGMADSAAAPAAAPAN
ncbi:hypothetical protein [Silanimonas sp.]|uniref:hypothetical protein n=1 Tax=Silanimonas sp. TaxID=1929290 RepID=UPI0022BFEBA0|nr:hypothetical protein [Silanimonas sp.]MCZ8164612.1 hypothetical protein [Silanimonas sp.]